MPDTYTMNKFLNLAALTLICPLIALPNRTFASGFAIYEQSLRGLGSAYSDAAQSNDASTVFFNTAGLGFLRGTEIAAGTHIIIPQVSFTDQGSITNPAIGGTSLAATSTNSGGDPGGARPWFPTFICTIRLKAGWVTACTWALG